jgi:hypothetical protein
VILLRGEWFLGFSGGACLAFLLYGENLFARLTEPAWLALIFVWLFTAALAVGHSALRGRAFPGRAAPGVLHPSTARSEAGNAEFWFTYARA